MSVLREKKSQTGTTESLISLSLKAYEKMSEQHPKPEHQLI